MLDRVFTVSELTDQIRRDLEQSFPLVHVEGEVSNFKISANRHWYFTLKDSKALIQAVMFRGYASAAKTIPSDGQIVRVTGSIGVYPPRGTYQILCRSISPAGEGEILAMLEERKRRLMQEGLFREDRKKPLPYFPQRAAIVTSPTGAAIRDILNVLKRRRARVSVVILPTPVQGGPASATIAAQIKRANRYGMADVIIVGRGGGSLEDLLAFSDEQVVRAIADSSIPVISAVGHETDVSLSDLAADVRAPTPSAAAEIVSAGGDEIHDRIMTSGGRIVQSYLSRLDRGWNHVRRFSSEELLYRYRNFVQPWYQRLDDARENTLTRMQERMTNFRHRLQLSTERMSAGDPKRPLERGYSLVRDEEGKVVALASMLRPSQRVNVEFNDGMWTMDTVDQR